MNDPTFAAGKIAFWTKSDSVSYFADARVTYTPRETFAQRLVDDTLKEYPRLLGLKMYVPVPAGNGDADDRQRRTERESATAGRGERRGRASSAGSIIISEEQRDGGGDDAVVRPERGPGGGGAGELKPMPGQTEENARIRALPIIKTMQQHMALVTKLTE